MLTTILIIKIDPRNVIQVKNIKQYNKRELMKIGLKKLLIFLIIPCVLSVYPHLMQVTSTLMKSCK